MGQSLDGARTATADALRAAGFETPALDARVLVSIATGLTHEALIADGRAPISPDAASRLRAFVRRRLDGEPIARIRGTREFYGRDFLLGPDTLDPRPDTETLVEAALALAGGMAARQRPARILELGTGTGCVLLTLLAECRTAQGFGTDISSSALSVAAENARRLGLEGRAKFAVADWFSGLTGQFDLIVSNPPYIASGDLAGLPRDVICHDPRAALDGGHDGLEAYRRIAASAPVFLSPGGALVVEVGVEQDVDVKELFELAGLRPGPDTVWRDLAGRPRCIGAFRHSQGTSSNVAEAKIGLGNLGLTG